MYLKRESSCFNHLRWRVIVDNSVSVEEFIMHLKANGFNEKIHPLYPKIVELEDKNKHRILFVPATNRIQLKLDIETDADIRTQVAEQLASEIVLALTKA